MPKKRETSKGRAKLKDLTPRKQTAAAVKGGRIINVRANANVVPVGPLLPPTVTK
jgi:hypothetical protein